MRIVAVENFLRYLNYQVVVNVVMTVYLRLVLEYLTRVLNLHARGDLVRLHRRRVARRAYIFWRRGALYKIGGQQVLVLLARLFNLLTFHEQVKTVVITDKELPLEIVALLGVRSALKHVGLRHLFWKPI